MFPTEVAFRRRREVGPAALAAYAVVTSGRALVFLFCRAEQNFVYVEVVGLADRERDAARERLGRDRDLADEALRVLADVGLGDAVDQLSCHRARRDDRGADAVGRDLLA